MHDVKMLFQVSFLAEALGAIRASVWLEATMQSNVVFNVACFIKSFLALAYHTSES